MAYLAMKIYLLECNLKALVSLEQLVTINNLPHKDNNTPIDDLAHIVMNLGEEDALLCLTKCVNLVTIFESCVFQITVWEFLV